MPKKSTKPTQSPLTTITLTLPSTASGVKRSGEGILLIQRGDLAHLQQIRYTNLQELGQLIQQAEITLVGLEIEPPQLPIPPDTPLQTTTFLNEEEEDEEASLEATDGDELPDLRTPEVIKTLVTAPTDVEIPESAPLQSTSTEVIPSPTTKTQPALF
jgi:hypothetical protein